MTPSSCGERDVGSGNWSGSRFSTTVLDEVMVLDLYSRRGELNITGPSPVILTGRYPDELSFLKYGAGTTGNLQ